MAKWDLSKLPEGRKPLPDEWFAERAQMQDRMKELQAKLANAEAMLEREIRRVKKIQLDLPKPHTVSLFSVQCEYELMLEELTGETMTDEDFEKIIDELEDEIADLKAKLSKAVEALDRIQHGSYAKTAAIARITLAKLTGGKDE